MSVASARRHTHDIKKLMMSSYEVSMGDDTRDFYVKFFGPADSPYAKGIWRVHVTLPVNYPYKSPSIGFCNPIFHPNVDEASGSVCLDVINQTWSPMYELVHIFDTFLPQLLLYPNPADPLNSEAAALLNRDPKAYERRVKDHVTKFASVDIKVSDDGDDDDEGSGGGGGDDDDDGSSGNGKGLVATTNGNNSNSLSSSSSSTSSSAPANGGHVDDANALGNAQDDAGLGENGDAGAGMGDAAAVDEEEDVFSDTEQGDVPAELDGMEL